MNLAEDALCRAVVGAHARVPGAAAALAALVSSPEFPWYASLAVLHRQGLRAAVAGLLDEVVEVALVPVNVRVELEREGALAEARDVVAWDRARRVERALAGSGLSVDGLSAGGLRVAPEGDVVRVSVPPGRAAEVTARLASLDRSGPRSREGRINRLEPPAIEVHEEPSLPPPERWRQVLQRADADSVELDAAAIARVPVLAEPEPEAPHIPPAEARVAPASVGEILAVRLGGVGDVLFALPALTAVKSEYPGARLVLQADTAQREHLVLRSECVDDVESFDWDLLTGDGRRRAEARQRFLERARAADLLVVFGPLPALFGIDHGTPTLELRVERGAGHTAAQLLAGARPAGSDSPVPALRVAGEERAAARQRLLASTSDPRPRPFIAFALGATTVYKMWPIEHFAALARDLVAATGGTVWVFPHGGEVKLADELAARAPVQQLAGVSLLELTPLLGECDLVVGNDTGPVHLAAAAGTPTLAIHGFTDPGFTGPLGPATATLGGMPTSRPGSEESIRGITPAEVMVELRRLVPGWFGGG